jgi:hypothetical protein
MWNWVVVFGPVVAVWMLLAWAHAGGRFGRTALLAGGAGFALVAAASIWMEIDTSAQGGLDCGGHCTFEQDATLVLFVAGLMTFLAAVAAAVVRGIVLAVGRLAGPASP